MALGENNELQNRLITAAKKSLENNDLYMAKSYFLTASSVFPNSFKIQFERYLLAKKEENVQECSRILTQMLNLPENESLNEEIEKIVDTVKSTSNSNENNFQKQLFTSLTSQQQYQLVLKVANKCDDQINYCQLMLLIMKKFPDRINEHAMNLVDIIINENKQKKLNSSTVYSKDYFFKLLVFDVFPLILSKESNLQLTTEQVEQLLENLFKIYFQQSSIGKVSEDETLHIECTTTMNQMQSKLREIFNLIRLKMNWESFLIPDQLTMSTLKEQHDQLMDKYSSTQQSSEVDFKLKQIFYTAFMLFLIYLDNYIKLTVSKLIIVQKSSPSVKNLGGNKKRKLNDSKQSITPVCNNDELQTAFSGFNQLLAFLNLDEFLQQKFLRMMQLIGLDRCKSYVIFITDTYFYKGDYSSILSYFKGVNEYSIKSCVQLVNSSLLTGDYSLTLECTVKLVKMISTHRFKVSSSSNQTFKIVASDERCQLTFVNYNKSDILSYAVDVAIKSLDEIVLNTNRPSDLGIGHMMVLSQYKWPMNILFFIKCLKLIKSNFQNSKFSYSSFMQYILNTDIVEEFRSLQCTQNKIELCIMKPAEMIKVKSMTTRGVNKNAKEEVKNALINQMRSSKIRLDDDLFIDFIINELSEFSDSSNSKKSTRR